MQLMLSLRGLRPRPGWKPRKRRKRDSFCARPALAARPRRRQHLRLRRQGQGNRFLASGPGSRLHGRLERLGTWHRFGAHSTPPSVACHGSSEALRGSHADEEGSLQQLVGSKLRKLTSHKIRSQGHMIDWMQRPHSQSQDLRPMRLHLRSEQLQASITECTVRSRLLSRGPKRSMSLAMGFWATSRKAR